MCGNTGFVVDPNDYWGLLKMRKNDSANAWELDTEDKQILAVTGASCKKCNFVAFFRDTSKDLT